MSTLTKLRDNIICDQISRDKHGHYIFRRSFFYKMGKNQEKFKDDILEQLNVAGFAVKLIDYGEKYAPFRGGAKIVNSSHWFVKVQLLKEFNND